MSPNKIAQEKVKQPSTIDDLLQFLQEIASNSHIHPRLILNAHGSGEVQDVLQEDKIVFRFSNINIFFKKCERMLQHH